MSLPARQQRILDGIGDALRVSEPRLAAMFAIFSACTATSLSRAANDWRELGELAGWAP